MNNLEKKYYFGNEISEYGLAHNRVDYRAFAKSFDAILNNDLINKTWDFGNWEQVSGGIDYDEIEELKEELEELDGEKCELIENDLETTLQFEELESKIEELEEKIEELESEPDIYQYFIVSDNAIYRLKEAGEIVFYNEELDIYLWGVTHYGTSWCMVLTNIKIDVDKE